MRRDNTHKIEELEVLCAWHPWFGRVVHVHEVIDQLAGGVVRCSPDGDPSRRWLELPQWMFERAACLPAKQLNLFGLPGATHPTPEFEWQQLPEKTRETVTALMVRLLIDHYRRDRGPSSTERVSKAAYTHVALGRRMR